MRYINYLEYLNLKNNKTSLLLKYRIFKNNKLFLKEQLSKELMINNIKLDQEQKKSIFIHIPNCNNDINEYIKNARKIEEIIKKIKGE
jgi:hypothetical protein